MTWARCTNSAASHVPCTSTDLAVAPICAQATSLRLSHSQPPCAVVPGWSAQLQPNTAVQDNLPLLYSHRTLPPIQDLHIKLKMSELTPVDLSWLHRQPFWRLHVELEADAGSYNMVQHAQALLQIQRLPLHRFTLRIGIVCAPAVQRTWKELELWVPMHLRLMNRVSVHDLQMLPSSPRLHISIDMCFKAEPVLLRWSAVASRPGSVRMTLQPVQPGCVLAVSGCSGQIPFQGSKEPWQFCVHGDVKVAGLPPSQRCT